MKSRSVDNTISDVFLWFNFQTGNLTGLRCRVKTQRAVVKIVPDRSQTSSYISWTSQLSATLANMALSGRGVSTLRVSLVPWLTTSAEAKRSPPSWGLVCTASRSFEELEPHIICTINTRTILIITRCCKPDKSKLIWSLTPTERGRFTAVGTNWDDFAMTKYHSSKTERFQYTLIYIRDHSTSREAVRLTWRKPLHTKPQPRSLTIKKSVTLVQCSILLKRNLIRAFIRISVIITSLFDALGNLCNEVI